MNDTERIDWIQTHLSSGGRLDGDFFAGDIRSAIDFAAENDGPKTVDDAIIRILNVLHLTEVPASYSERWLSDKRAIVAGQTSSEAQALDEYWRFTDARAQDVQNAYSFDVLQKTQDNTNRAP